MEAYTQQQFVQIVKNIVGTRRLCSIEVQERIYVKQITYKYIVTVCYSKGRIDRECQSAGSDTLKQAQHGVLNNLERKFKKEIQHYHNL